MTARRSHLLCPVAGCGARRAGWQAVCPSCWSRLPPDLRGQVQSARRLQARHLEARAAMAAAAWLVQHGPGVAIARRIGEPPG